MATLLKDVRYALRMLWKQPGFAAVALREPERVLLVRERNPQGGFERGSVAPGNFHDLRAHEIGVRMALGAGPRAVLRLVVRQGMILTFAGLALGLGASLLLARGMSKVLYGVSATDPLTFAGISLLLAAAAFAANYFPARRATRAAPSHALRYE